MHHSVLFIILFSLFWRGPSILFLTIIFYFYFICLSPKDETITSLVILFLLKGGLKNLTFNRNYIKAYK